MPSHSSNNWRNVHLAVIVCLSLVLIITGASVSRYVSEGLLSSLYYPFFSIRDYIADMVGVSQENARLQQQLVDARMKVSLLESAARENERLRQALGFEPPPGYSLVPAEVVAIVGEQASVGAVINRGAADSVFVDQPLINQSGLVGRVVHVMPGYAEIQYLTDPANRVAARVIPGREMGIVKFLPGSGLILDNFPVDGSIKPGDRVVSSGLGGVYPAGLTVGEVVTVIRPAEEPFCEVDLKASVNFNTVEEVFLLKPEGP
ncbi:rod shape-determining protein MreC [candidate division GN15 bacterium]|nr:rod shape-determining protein MreC [candidate division GN15 bacterium]